MMASAAVVAAMAVTSIIQLRRHPSRAFSDASFVVVDGVLTMAFVLIYAFDPTKYLFSVSFGVVAEAALLLGLRAAVLTWGGLSVAYSGKEAFGALLLGVPTEPVGVALRVIILLGIALVMGSLVEAARSARAYATERDAAERLRQIDDMKNAFLTAVSHDLKNPLSAILGFSTTLEARVHKLPPERTAEFLGHISRNERRLDAMLNDLLDMDRINRGILEPELKATDMAALVRSIVSQVDLKGRVVTVDAEAVSAQVDPPKVERIVENLITNAIKYTPAGSEIALRVASSNGGVILAVEDNGDGVPDTLKEMLFEPFQRGPGAEKQATGSGIGLSLVSRFAELHGGRAWVEDAPGGGASFRVYLPSDPVPR